MVCDNTKGTLRLTFKPGVGIILLIALMIFGLTVTSFITVILQRMENSVAAIRIGAVIQDILVFILPAIATAMLATRLPAKFLRLDKLPSANQLLLSICIIVFSTPLINLIMELNKSISLPESMAAMETAMRSLEETANATLTKLMGGTGVGSLVISLLIVGILAGFSEEIFFRGSLQRLIGFNGNKHTAIILTAFIFSAIHLQFYGFFPRLLLGALFGYLYYWSGSLIVPVFAHAFNNSMYVVVKWLMERNVISSDIDSIGTTSTGADITTVILSIVIVSVAIYYFHKISAGKNV